MNTAKTHPLRQKVKEILLQEWDPIGVGIEDAPRDEYDAYVAKVYELAVERGLITEVIEYLLTVETQQMGLRGDLERVSRVAKKLVELR